jgi:hypothetical protein
LVLVFDDFLPLRTNWLNVGINIYSKKTNPCMRDINNFYCLLQFNTRNKNGQEAFIHFKFPLSA